MQVSSRLSALGGFRFSNLGGRLCLMKFSVLLSVLLLFSCCPLAAQKSDMDEWLNIGTDKERVQHLVALGVEHDAAESFVSLPANHYVEWKPIRTESRRDHAILFLPCSLDSAYLYVLVNDGTDWRVTDHLDLDCHYDDSVSIESAMIRKFGVEDLLVHHASEGHGTGFSQQNFKVFTVADGNLKPVLDTEEVLIADPSPVGSHTLFQRSTFVTIPRTGSRSSVIEETMSITRNGRLKVRRRYFRWMQSAGHYVPSKFTDVEALDN
jgi:hypothetical protein